VVSVLIVKAVSSI